MNVALHSAPKGFLNSNPPYTNDELLDLVWKAASLGFKCFQIGPLTDFVEIDGKRLKKILNRYSMKSSVHVGGLYDAEKFSASEEEYFRAQKEIRGGIELCREINSKLVSFHPPFFTTRDFRNKEFLSKARTCFFKLVKEEAEYAYSKGISVALESFCYPPFIFSNLRDFMRFVSHFPLGKLGILLEVGHLYQAKFDLDEAVQIFKTRLLDIHIHDAILQEDFRKATHLPIEKGTIDFPNLISNLRKVGYNGWLTLEIHGSEEEIIESKRILESMIK